MKFPFAVFGPRTIGRQFTRRRLSRWAAAAQTPEGTLGAVFVLVMAVALALLFLSPGPVASDDALATAVPDAPRFSAGPGLASATPAAGDAPAGQERPWVPAASVDTEVRRLAVAFDNKPVNIKNGGTVNLGDGLAVEIFADPYPAATLTVWLDLYLTQDGLPVSDAGMGIAFDMLAMVHGPFWGEAENIGGGHYLFTLDYLMFGPWEQIITIRMGGFEVIDVPVVLSAHP